MTVLSLMGAGGEASLWPHCRRELEAESLLRRRAETPLSCSSPQGQGTCWPWQMGGQYCTSSLGGGAHPPAGEGAWGVCETGGGVSRGGTFEGPVPHLLLCWGTTVPGWARLDKEERDQLSWSAFE